MGAYRLSRKAAADVEGIYTYTIEQHDLALARQYLDGLHACFEHLAEHPMLGRRADRIALGVRRHECRSHTLKFGKKLQNHAAHVALHFTHYNFCRIHKTLRMSPAMAAGVTDTLRDAEWIVGLVEARQRTWTPEPKKGAKYRPRKRSWSVWRSLAAVALIPLVAAGLVDVIT